MFPWPARCFLPGGLRLKTPPVTYAIYIYIYLAGCFHRPPKPSQLLVDGVIMITCVFFYISLSLSLPPPLSHYTVLWLPLCLCVCLSTHHSHHHSHHDSADSAGGCGDLTPSLFEGGLGPARGAPAAAAAHGPRAGLPSALGAGSVD